MECTKDSVDKCIKQFDQAQNSLRDFLELCINEGVIISAHNRVFGWEEDNCISYINNALRKNPHIGHPISVFSNYQLPKLKGIYFYSNPSETAEYQKLRAKDSFLEMTNFNEKFIMKDGRHKIQVFIWLVTGQRIKLKNSQEKRFFIKFKIEPKNEREIKLTLEDGNRIHLLENQDDIFLDTTDKNEYLYILFKICDDLWYKSDPDFIEKIDPLISKITKYSNFSFVIHTSLLLRETQKQMGIIYSALPSVTNKISFQKDDIGDIKDEYLLAEIIRDIQLGVKWDELDILETWAEYDIKDEDFRIKSQLLYEEFKRRKFLVGVGADASHILYSYTTYHARGVGKGDLGITVNCSDSDKKIKLKQVIENFDEISDFLVTWFSYIENLNKSLIAREYFQFFHFIGPWLYRRNYKDLLSLTSPGNFSQDMLYIIKLLYKIVFKFYPAQKKILSKNSWRIVTEIYNKISRYEKITEKEFYEIENLINENSSKDTPFKEPITCDDLTNNYKLLWPILYGQYGIYDITNKDIDHDISTDEFNKYPWTDSKIKEIYLNKYHLSYINLMPLFSDENRKQKRDKTQFEWYSSKSDLMKCRLIDPNYIDSSISPYNRIRAHKFLKDQRILIYFKQFGFKDEEFDFSMP